MDLITVTFLGATVASPILAHRAWKRASPGARREVRSLYLQTKVRSGRYSLSDLLDLLAQIAVDRCLRVNGKPMLPSDLSFGLHGDDYAKMHGLVPQLEHELVELLGEWLMRERGRTDGPIMVTIHRDDQAEPGRPTLTARAPGARRRPHAPTPGRTRARLAPRQPQVDARQQTTVSSPDHLAPTEWLPDDLRPTEFL